jgi:DNA-binding protein HU-beta
VRDETSRIWPTGPLAIQLDLNTQTAAFVKTQQVASPHADKNTSLETSEAEIDGGVARVTKRQFVQRAAAEAGLPKTTVAKAIEVGLNLIGNTLSQGEDVSLPGFGTFSVTHWPERTGLNPKTHQRISIPASRVPRFKPGLGLKRAIND